MVMYDHGKSVPAGKSNKKKKRQKEHRRGLDESQTAKGQTGTSQTECFPCCRESPASVRIGQFTAARANGACHRLAVA